MNISRYFKIKTFHNMYLKMLRNAGSPEYNARGAALGLFIGFMIPMGLQLLIVVPLAFLLRASKVLACTFTFVTNHVTILIIYPIQCYVGSYLLFNPLRYPEVSERLKHLIHAGDMRQFLHALCDLGVDLGAAFFAGGLLFGAIAAIIGYFSILVAFRRYQALNNARRGTRQKK